MPGYKHPCKYCSALVDGDARVCPFCGRVSPFDSLRCPGCSAPVQKGWLACSACGFKLETVCSECLKSTLQPPLGDKCRNCGKPLK